MGFKPVETSSTNAEMNLIGKGTYVEGQIVTEGNLRVDGKVKGKVITKNKLHIGPSGEIDGEIRAKDAVVCGKVKGTVKIENKLELEAQSQLVGDLNAKILVIDEGAIFHGNSTMGDNKPDAIIPKPEEKKYNKE